MSTDAERRELYDALVTNLGPGPAGTLMAGLLFPADRREMARQPDLLALGHHFTELRGEFTGLRGEFAELRGEFAELRGEFGELRGEVRGELAEIRGESVPSGSVWMRSFQSSWPRTPSPPSRLAAWPSPPPAWPADSSQLLSLHRIP